MYGSKLLGFNPLGALKLNLQDNAKSDRSSSNPQKAEPEIEQTPEAPKGGRIIRTVLAPALRLWLRSQVESVEQLTVELEGGDRQIISGKIPALSVAAVQAVYQGLQLSRIALVGRNIRMNLGQAVRGKPLRLLEPIEVTAELQLQSEDLNASLAAALLAPALEEWLGKVALLLSQSDGSATSRLTDLPTDRRRGKILSPQVNFGVGVLQLRADWQPVEEGLGPGDVGLGDAGKSDAGQNDRQPIALQFQPVISQGNQLEIRQLRWLTPPPVGLRQDLDSLKIPPFQLGSDVCFESFEIQPNGLNCRGLILINP